MKEKIGLMGGTFDPIHVGHLLTAEAVREQFGLARVIFIPAAQPPHKQGRQVAPAYARLIMTEMAVAGNPSFAVSRIELQRSGPSYSVDTLRELQAAHGREAEYYFITGADAINELYSWHEAETLLESCHFIAATRQGCALDLLRLEGEMGEALVRSHVHELPTPELEISSTDIRRRVQEGRSIKYLVTAEVEAYIYKEGLYR